MAPRSPRRITSSASALKTLGRYDEALDHLRIAAEQYPRDRVVLNQIGRVQFLQRQFDEAIASLQAALAVDPEDLEAHYNLMLCYQGMGDASSRRASRRCTCASRPTSPAQAITGPYRLKSPRQQRAAADPRARRRRAAEPRGSVDGVTRGCLCIGLTPPCRGASCRQSALHSCSWRLSPPLRLSPSRTSRRRPASASSTTAARSARNICPRRWARAVVVLDADGDGWQDLLLVNSKNWPGRPGPRSSAGAVSQQRNGTFADITRGSGLDVELYGIGGAAADYDNDGKVDVYITALGGNRLFRNLGGGKFADVTGKAGVADGGFSTSALWFDYDNDGKLDLFVAHYVEWSIDEGSVLHARRQEQVLLHAGVLQGPEPVAVPQPRRRHVRERHRSGPASTTRPRRGLAWRCSISTATAGWICSSPTTPSPTACIATTATARSRTSRWRPASRSARPASRAPAWASTPPTTTARDGRASSSATSRTR